MSDPAIFVYVIGAVVGPQKIGIARDVEDRKKHVQVGCPFDLVTHHVVAEEKAIAAATERLAHARLAPYRQRGEWFNVSPAAAIAAVERSSRDARQGRDAPRSVKDMDGVEWLRRFAGCPLRLLEAALAYRELAEFCARGSQSVSAEHAEGFSHRRVTDATRRFDEINRGVVLAAGDVGLRALSATAFEARLPTPGAERELIQALDVVAARLGDTISA